MPKTIDNDIVETTNTFGFDTAVSFATDAIDRLHTTAEAHHRVMVVEVMGRYAGWIALYAGVAGGADVILIPEIPVRHREGRASGSASARHMGARFSIVVVAEGAKPVGGQVSRDQGRRRARSSSGSAASAARVAAALEQLTGKETRSVVLGHLQRGGAPTSFDRILATRFGARAVELLHGGQVRSHGRVPSARHRRGAARQGRRPHRTVPPDFDVVRTARAMGISLGD